MDRDYTIDDFKRKVRTLMVATSVAGRGLDVKDLVLVINYHCPNHLEDYVHRVGRTGRAGNKGTAYTFISPDEEEYAPDLVKALENADQNVPLELSILNDKFKDKVKRGLAKYHGSGFKGKGYTFDENEKSNAQKIADMQQKQYEIEQGFQTEEAVEEKQPELDETQQAVLRAKQKAAELASEIPGGVQMSAAQKAQHIANMFERQFHKKQESSSSTHFMDDLEINDYPQQARWKITSKETSNHVSELTGAAIIARGTYVAPGRKPPIDERKLYLVIEGSSWKSVQDAKRELQRILNETTLQVGLGSSSSKYSI